MWKPVVGGIFLSIGLCILGGFIGVAASRSLGKPSSLAGPLGVVAGLLTSLGITFLVL